MAIQLGSIVDPSQDIFASTGAHGDFRVIPQFGPNKGQAINPRFARSLLTRITAGGTPLTQKGEDGQYTFNFPVTSEFGPREAPTAGASTYHEGIDLGIGAGTPLAYTGEGGTYTPGKGMGTLSITDDQGQPYDIQLLHTVPGAASETVAPPEASGDKGNVLNVYFGEGSQYKNQKEKSKSLLETFKEQVMMDALKDVMDPMGGLQDNFDAFKAIS